MRTSVWNGFIILSLIGGLNSKEDNAIAKVPRKVLVIETDLEDQRTFFERHKGRDFINK